LGLSFVQEVDALADKVTVSLVSVVSSPVSPGSETGDPAPPSALGERAIKVATLSTTATVEVGEFAIRITVRDKGEHTYLFLGD